MGSSAVILLYWDRTLSHRVTPVVTSVVMMGAQGMLHDPLGQFSGALCSEGVSEKHQLKPQAQGNCCAHGLGGTSHPRDAGRVETLKSPLPLGPPWL